jgi:hypothetical protein
MIIRKERKDSTIFVQRSTLKMNKIRKIYRRKLRWKISGDYVFGRYCFILNKITLCFIFTSVNILYIFVTLYFFTGKKTHHDNSGLSLTLTVAAFWRRSLRRCSMLNFLLRSFDVLCCQVSKLPYQATLNGLCVILYKTK